MSTVTNLPQADRTAKLNVKRDPVKTVIFGFDDGNGN